jgi:tetratricopeptide (TPR) repeat protein
MRRLLVLAACFLAAGFGQSNDCDSAESCQKVLEANRRSSLAHYRVGEIFFQQGNIQSAANEFRSALDGDLDPGWIEVWSHVSLGNIFAATGQTDRAANEYWLAQCVKGNSPGVLHARASGDQIYTCDGSEWALSGPDAKLFDEAGNQVGSHFAGPTWQWMDGSQVKGKPVANITLDAESIPWLLLTATDHAGDGAMKNVSSIQRLRTSGGKAPASGCGAAHKEEKTRVHYTADYYFYSIR